MRHVRVPAFTTASTLDLISPQSVAHICGRNTTLNLPSLLRSAVRNPQFATSNLKHLTSNPPTDGFAVANISGSAHFALS
jgi:hypothetical protein